MEELGIERHDFELAKERLKEFSELNETELEIDGVKTDGGLFGWGNHKVTGDELNDRLQAIQQHMIDINTTNTKTIKEFKEVYNALDALDKDYIQCILANVKAVEKTSDDIQRQQDTLKKHHEKITEQQGKLDAHQIEIEKNVKNISKVVDTLKKFKDKIDGYQHLDEVDKIWGECEKVLDQASKVSALEKKLKYSYFMAGGALVIAVVEFILVLAGVV